MSMTSSFVPHKSGDTLARQALKKSAQSLSRSRNVWHFMAWSFVVAETAAREAYLDKHGAQDTGGDIDLSKSSSSDGAAISFGSLSDNVYSANPDPGLSSDGTDSAGLANTALSHSEFSMTMATGVAPVTGVEIVALAEISSQITTVFGSGGSVHFPVGSSTFFAAAPSINWPAPTNGYGGAFHQPGTAGPIGGPIGGPGVGPGGPVPIIPVVPVVTVYDGPPITYAKGISPFSEKLGLGTAADAVPGATLTGAQAPVKAAMDFTSNPFAPTSAWQGLGVGDQPVGLFAGDRADVQYLIQANGYGSQGSSQLQLSNVPTDPATAAQHTELVAKTATNTAVLLDDGGDFPLFIKGNYYEFNTIIQLNITSNDDTISVLRTGAGDEGPSLISTGHNQQHNIAYIGDAAWHDHESAPAIQAASTETATVASEPTAPASTTTPDTEATQAHDAGPHKVVVGPITQHFAAIQIAHVSAADTISFNFEDYLSGDATDIRMMKFADIDAGGDIQTNTSVMAFNTPISQAGYDARDFVKAHGGGPIEIVHGDYYKINTIFQLNLALDSNTIRKTVGDSLASAGLGDGGGGSGIIASGGNIAFNTASIVKQNTQDMYVGGKYTQYNLVLQINALSDNGNITETSAIQHQSAGADGGAIGIDHTASGHNGSDGGLSAFSLPDPVHELALRGGQTIDQSF